MTTEAALKAWETRRANGWVHPNALDVVEDARPKAKPVQPTKKPTQSAAKPARSTRKAAKVTKTARQTVRSKATKPKRRRG